MRHIAYVNETNSNITICQNCEVLKCSICRERTRKLVMYSETFAFNAFYDLEPSQGEFFCTKKECLHFADAPVCQHSNLIYPSKTIVRKVLNSQLQVPYIWKNFRLEMPQKQCKICGSDLIVDAISYASGKCIKCSTNKPCKTCKTIYPSETLDKKGNCKYCVRMHSTYGYIDTCHNYLCLEMIEKEDRRATVFCKHCSNAIKEGRCANCLKEKSVVNDYGLCENCST